MQDKSANYSTIFNNPLHYAEVKLVVGQTTYGMDKIMSVNTSASLFGDAFNIGNIVMNSFEATLYDVLPSAIPKLSRVEIWARLTLDGTSANSTNWLPKGVYYTKKPSYESESKLLTISGYDEVYKTQVIPFPKGATTITNWQNPSLIQVAQHLLKGTDVSGVISSSYPGIGIDLEANTSLQNYPMTNIPFGYTIRDVLSEIAIASSGNWTAVFKEENGSQVTKLRFCALPLRAYDLLIDENNNTLVFGNDRIIV